LHASTATTPPPPPLPTRPSSDPTATPMMKSGDATKTTGGSTTTATTKPATKSVKGSFVSADSMANTVVLKVGGKEMTYSVSADRSEEHTSELQSRGHLVCRPLL